MAVDAAGTLLAVADGQNHRVQLFESDGTVSKCMGGGEGRVFLYAHTFIKD